MKRPSFRSTLLLTCLLTQLFAANAIAAAIDDVSLRQGGACNLNLYGNRTGYSGTQIYIANHNEGSAVLALIKIVSTNNRGQSYTSYKRIRIEAGSEEYVGCTAEGSEYGSAGLSYQITGAHYVD